MTTLIDTLATLLTLLLIIGLIVWFTRHVLIELLTGRPHEVKLAQEIGQKINRLNRYEHLSEETLAEVYTQLNALADVVQSIYQRYRHSTTEALKLTRLQRTFSRDEKGRLTVNQTKFVEICASLSDNSLTALLSNAEALGIPSYLEQVYFAVLKNKADYQHQAESYQETAGQLFEEINLIRRRFSEIKTHIQAVRASRYVIEIENKLDIVSQKLLIDGDKPLLQRYVKGGGV